MTPDPTFDFTWETAVPDTVPNARHRVLDHLRAAKTPDPPLSDIALALSEAVSNVVTHAYRNADEPGPVRVRVATHLNEVEVLVEDAGPGMHPRIDSPGLGLGLPLIAALASRYDVRRAPSGGTRMCLWFETDPAAQTLPA